MSLAHPIGVKPFAPGLVGRLVYGALLPMCVATEGLRKLASLMSSDAERRSAGAAFLVRRSLLRREDRRLLRAARAPRIEVIRAAIPSGTPVVTICLDTEAAQGVRGNPTEVKQWPTTTADRLCPD